MASQGQGDTPLDLSNEPLVIHRHGHGKKKYQLMSASQNAARKTDETEMPVTANSSEAKPSISSGSDEQRNHKEPSTSSASATLSVNQVESLPGSIPVQPPKKQNRKRKVVNPSNDDNLKNNPLQRGKYGLRMMPQQVDYYQSMLEEQKAKVIRDSLRTSSESKEPEEVQEEAPLPAKRNRRPAIVAANVSTAKPLVPESQSFDVGEIAWATLPTYKYWFPALIISHIHCGQRPPKNQHTWVYWFGDHQVSEVSKSRLKSFIANFPDLTKGKSALTSLRMKEALQVLSSRAGLSLPQSTPTSEDDALIEWAKSGFQVPRSSSKQGGDPFKPDANNPIPALAACYLPLDLHYLDKLKNTEDRSQQIAFYEVESAPDANAVEEAHEPMQIPEFKTSQVERVKKGEIAITDICIGCCCDYNRAADSAADGRRVYHPLFEGLLCKQCLETIKTTMYAPGEDDKNSFCAICGQVGNLAVCDIASCHRVFCFVCINLYVEPEGHLKIVEADSWECYICRLASKSSQGTALPSSALLKPKSNWRENVRDLFDPIRSVVPKKLSFLKDKAPLRVFSVFDGIGTVERALDGIGLKAEMIMSSEGDRDAAAIARKKKSSAGGRVFLDEKPDSLSIDKIAALCPVDLVIGSVPCDDATVSQSSRKALLLDNKGVAHHAIYFSRTLNLLREANPVDRQLFFLLACVAPTQFAGKELISDLLLCKPVTLAVKELTVNNKCCYFWSNIPGVNRPLPAALQERYGKILAGIQRKSAATVEAGAHPQANAKSAQKSADEAHASYIEEIEVLAGFESGLTATGASDAALPRGKRHNLLARSWPVPILSHILWALNDFFKSNK